MTSPSSSPQQIRGVAEECDYFERREEASSTLFFQKNCDGDCPTLVNVFYTTQGVMTKVSHPEKGYNQLWRSNAYDSLDTLSNLLRNPRMHTGKGYRKADMAVRGCIQCGFQKTRNGFSKNQWRKGAGVSKCQDCISSRSYDPGPSSGSAAMPSNRNHTNTTTHAPVSREYITCDSSNCEAESPAILCDVCEMVYYCSQTCRIQHRHEHSPDCHAIDQMRARVVSNQGGPDRFTMKGYAMATMASGKSTFEARLLQAEYIHQEDGDWDLALAKYMELVMRGEEAGTPIQWRKAWMGMSRCFYEIGEYDKAIAAGSLALEMNRHFPQAHKYVALAQKASGDLESAIATMSRAVLYEAPWEDENLEVNKALLKELTS